MNLTLKEGGLGGHMAHIYENGELTFAELKDALSSAANGQLKGTEKTDGQNIKLSFNVTTKRAVGARNAGQVKSGGLNVDEMAEFFSKHPNPNLKPAFSDSVKIFERAVSSLSEQQQLDLFGPDVNIWYNAEVMDDRTRNVVNYDSRNLLIHRTGHVFFNRETQKFEEPPELEEKSQRFMNYLEKVQDNVSDSRHAILVNPIQTLKKLDDQTQLNVALKKIQDLMSSEKLSDKNTIFDYLISSLDKNLVSDLPTAIKRKIIFSNLDIQKINKRELKKNLTPEQKQEVDRLYAEFPRYMKQATMPLEVIITDFAAAMLKTLESIFILDNKAETDRLAKEVEQAIKAIQSSGNKGDIEFLTRQLEKLKGADTISSAVEGFAFSYKGKIYKFTGKFAPVNQILGLFKYGRGGSKPSMPEDDVISEEISGMYDVALLGGGFKPPHKGHIELLKQLSQKARRVVVLTSDTSSKGRTFETGMLAGQLIDGAVCNLFLEKMLDAIPELDNVEIKITKSPLGDIFKYVKEESQQGERILLGVGGKEEDASRFDRIGTYAPPEKNLVVDVEVLAPVVFDQGTLSASKLREAISNKQLEVVAEFIPNEIPDKIEFAREMVEAFFSNADVNIEEIIQEVLSLFVEMEPYQRMVTAKHPAAKERLTGGGEVKDKSTPYKVKLSLKRGKSAPPGAGG